MNYIDVTYATYLTLSIALTVWVARTLFKNGRGFLVDVFAGNEELADSINHLLVVGFYLINLGFIALFLKQEGDVQSTRIVIENLAAKMGVVMLVLGGMHFFNLALLSSARKSVVNQKANEERWDQQEAVRRGIPPVRPVL